MVKARKLTVERKGYKVRPTEYKREGKTIKREGYRVKPTTFKIKDRGKKGRGKKIIPRLKKGTLGVDFDLSADKRRRILSSLSRKIGEKKVMGKLQALVVFNKRTNPEVSKKAAFDRRWVASSFIGKKRVKTGRGLTSKR